MTAANLEELLVNLNSKVQLPRTHSVELSRETVSNKEYTLMQLYEVMQLCMKKGT